MPDNAHKGLLCENLLKQTNRKREIRSKGAKGLSLMSVTKSLILAVQKHGSTRGGICDLYGIAFELNLR